MFILLSVVICLLINYKQTKLSSSLDMMSKRKKMAKGIHIDNVQQVNSFM